MGRLSNAEKARRAEALRAETAAKAERVRAARSAGAKKRWELKRQRQAGTLAQTEVEAVAQDEDGTSTGRVSPVHESASPSGDWNPDMSWRLEDEPEEGTEASWNQILTDTGSVRLRRAQATLGARFPDLEFQAIGGDETVQVIVSGHQARAIASLIESILDEGNEP